MAPAILPRCASVASFDRPVSEVPHIRHPGACRDPV